MSYGHISSSGPCGLRPLATLTKSDIASANGVALPTLANSLCALALRQRAYFRLLRQSRRVTAIHGCLSLRAGAASVVGVDLETADTLLLQ